MGRSVSPCLYYGLYFGEGPEFTYNYGNDCYTDAPDWVNYEAGFAESLETALEDKLTEFPPYPEGEYSKEVFDIYYKKKNEAEKRRGLDTVWLGWSESETLVGLSAKTFREHDDLAELHFYVNGYYTPEMNVRLWNAIEVLDLKKWIGDQKPAWHLDYSFG